MKIGINIIVALFCLLAAVVVGQAVYYWSTYIDETVYSGSAYGFEIGWSKEQVVRGFARVRTEHPYTHVYVSYGDRAGDNFSIPASDMSIGVLQTHDHWELLLDAKWEFWNSIDLYFQNGVLIQIYRHRQYFELP